ncbi:MAG TPA: AAA family ATPase [Candidatus Limnocylindrales bacterium]|nr:AAA family ATPase [Candidatus Limnocylindrales bacterium]
MHISRLHLQNFRRHSDLTLDLAPGLNVVRGPNEAGKSTVQRAIEMALFRRPTSSSQDLDDSRQWRQPDSDPTVELDFAADEERGSLRKVFAGHRGTVELRIGAETIVDPAAVEAHMARLTGLPSEKFFRATASVHHQELTGLTQDESTLRDRLQQSMSGADRGTHAARRKLEEAIRRYRTEGVKNPGYLKVLRTDVERLREQVRRGEQALEQLERDRRILAEARALRAAQDERLAEQRENVARAERAVTLTTKIADSTRRYAVYKRAAELRGEMNQLQASHPSTIPLPTLKATVEYLRNREFNLSEMRAELAAEPDLSGYDAALVEPRWRPLLTAAAVLFVMAALAAIAGVVLVQPVIGLITAVAVGVLAAIAAFAGVGRRRRVEDVRMQNELRESEIARRLAGRTDLAERVGQAEQQRAEALASIGLSDLSRAETMLAAEVEHAAQIGARKAEYRGLLGDDPADEDVSVLRDQAAAEADESRHALAGMGDVGREPEKHLAVYVIAVQKLTSERDTTLQQEATAEARVTANEVDAEVVAADAEALGSTQESLASAERRLRIYEDVLATLNDAERTTMKKAARFLEQRMARDVEKVTGGRYRRLKVDEQTLTFTVFSPETNDWLDVRQLSQGTLDQLYLCARLGIVRQVTSPAAPPLIFDDPFITFDETRAARAVGLLKELARDNQVIYLTTSDRYDAQADKVIELPEPLDRDEPEPIATASGPTETLSFWSSSAIPVEPRANGHHGAPATAADAPGQPPVEPAPEPTPLWPVEER